MQVQDDYERYLDCPVWGAAAIGKVINRTEHQVHHMIQTKLLRTRKVGKIHTSTVRTLLEDVTPKIPAE
jgi:hypothetical protein